MDCHNLQVVLSNLLIWSNDWQLKVNVIKCHILHLQENNPLVAYYVNHIRLESCYLINDIGVDIDSILHFDKHIDRIVPRLILVSDYYLEDLFQTNCLFSGELTLRILDHF